MDDNIEKIEMPSIVCININKVILQGVVCNTPILRMDNNNTPVTNFGLNTCELIKNKDNLVTIRKKHNIVAWGDLAKKCCEGVKKNSLLYIEGTLNYITKHDKRLAEVKLTFMNDGKINITQNIDTVSENEVNNG